MKEIGSEMLDTAKEIGPAVVDAAKEIELEGVNDIYLNKDKDQWRVLVNKAFRFPTDREIS
jgi:hypothetical protein